VPAALHLTASAIQLVTTRGSTQRRQAIGVYKRSRLAFMCLDSKTKGGCCRDRGRVGGKCLGGLWPVAWSGSYVVVEGDVPGGAGLVAAVGCRDQRGAVGGAAARVGQRGAGAGIDEGPEIVGGHLADSPFLAGRPGARRNLGLGAGPSAGDVQASSADPKCAVAVTGPLLGAGAGAALPRHHGGTVGGQGHAHA